MRRVAPLLVAVGLVALVVVPYLALGGGSYEPTPVADPCEERAQRDPDGVAETIEFIALSAVDNVACELEVSREDLVLALRSEEAFQTFSDEHAIEQVAYSRGQQNRQGVVVAVVINKYDEERQEGQPQERELIGYSENSAGHRIRVR